ncbi:MAG: hypothetical protein L3J65_01820 [Robiginitomaculum sp.]|nr:hypothetical protein [Robiginitomaculum sp.]
MTPQTDTLSLARPNSISVALMVMGNLIPLVGVIWWGWTGLKLAEKYTLLL